MWEKGENARTFCEHASQSAERRGPLWIMGPLMPPTEPTMSIFSPIGMCCGRGHGAHRARRTPRHAPRAPLHRPVLLRLPSLQTSRRPHAPCEREAHAHAQPLSCSGRCCTRAILVTSGVAWARRARAHAHTDLDVTARSRSRLPPRQMTHDPHVLARSSLPSRHPPRCYRRHRPCEPIRRRGNGQWFAETSHDSIRPRCTEARTHARRRRRGRGS